MVNWLKEEWNQLASKFTNDMNLVNELWIEIHKRYSSKNRYYHNLNHIYNMFQHMYKIEAKITELDEFKFSIWYHDIIYKSTSKDNEIQSALTASKILNTLNIDSKSIEKIKQMIISSHKHEVILDKNLDNAYFLDIDLSILGTTNDSYQDYIKSIRKEYKIYPDLLYNPGRKKVLKKFQQREHIFFTSYFIKNFEKQARLNLTSELLKLS